MLGRRNGLVWCAAALAAGCELVAGVGDKQFTDGGGDGASSGGSANGGASSGGATTGGASSGGAATGGTASGGVAGDVSVHDGGDGDASQSSGDGGHPGEGGTDASDAVAEAEPPETGLVADGGPTCGVAYDANSAVVNFDCAAIKTDFFDFLTPDESLSGPGNWHWVRGADTDASSETYLLQTTRVSGTPFANVIYGTLGIYRPIEVEDGFVSVRAWSYDFGRSAIVARYTDDLHYYRFSVSRAGDGVRRWFLERMEGASSVVLASREDGPPGNYHVPPGLKISLEFVGNHLRASVEDQVVADLTDVRQDGSAPEAGTVDRSLPWKGRVGVEAIGQLDANFDSLTIVRYPKP